MRRAHASRSAIAWSETSSRQKSGTFGDEDAELRGVVDGDVVDPDAVAGDDEAAGARIERLGRARSSSS